WLRSDGWLAHPSMGAIASDARNERAAGIRRNAAALGVPGLHVIEGTAPEVFEGLAQADAIFIGGGARIVLDPATRALRVGGRLVVNAVTTETEALLLRRQATIGGGLRRIAIWRVEPGGGRGARGPTLPPSQRGRGKP